MLGANGHGMHPMYNGQLAQAAAPQRQMLGANGHGMHPMYHQQMAQ